MSEELTAPAAERAHTADRRRRLAELLRDGEGNIHDLARGLGVSVSTIRRDLAALADRGEVMRTYGGAVHAGAVVEKSWHDKELAHHAEKDVIARHAAELVQPGDLVLLDAGTSVGRLAHYLKDRRDVTVVTNGLSALLVLADAAVDVIVLGGRLRRPNEALLGAQVERELRRLSPDIAFLGADSLDAARGVNCPVPEQASVKELMASTARETWVLADHSKLDGTAPFAYWAPVPAGTGLLTDGAPPAEFGARHWQVRRVHT